MTDNERARDLLPGLLTRRRLLEAGGGLTMAAFLAACGGDDDDAESSTSAAGSTTETGSESTGPDQIPTGGKITLGIVGAPNETTNPFKLLTGTEGARAFAIYDPLVRLAGESGEPEPWLAETVEPSSDNTVWTFKLRTGVKFHDGRPLTADDVIYTLEYNIDPANGTDRQSSLAPVVDMAKTRKVDDTTVEIALKQPNAAFPLLLTFVFVIPDGETAFDPPIGTGPFKFDSWKAGASTLLSKNPDWWLSGQPYIDELEIVNVADPQARLNALQGGQVDLVSQIDFAQAKGLEGNDAVKLLRTPGSRNVPFYMRIDNADFKDVRVRQALKLAVDRQQLVDNVLLGYGSIGNDMFGEGYSSYPKDVEQRPYDPEAAKALLTEAGASDLQVTLTSSKAVPGMLEAATAFAEQAKAAGITIKVQEVPADQYFSGQYYLKVPFAQSDWSERFEVTAPAALLSEAPYNETAWLKPEFDARFAEAAQTSDAEARDAIYHELQRQQWEEGGYIIWGFQEIIDASTPRVNGIPIVRNRTLGNFDLSAAWVGE